MSLLTVLLRIFSYLFHLILSGFLLGITSLALLGGQHNLQLGMLPWTDEELTWWLFGLSLFGLLSLILAVLGRLRILFVMWAIVALVLIVKGYFLSPYTFDGPEEFRFAALLTGGALLAFFGSLTQFRRAKRR
jgi:hypothetical protein